MTLRTSSSRLLRGRRPRSARGVALLLVLVVLLLVATLATEIALTARTHFRLADHSMNDFLLRSVIDGRRHVLLSALRYDATLGDSIDTEADQWAWHNSSTLSSWGEAAGTAADDAGAAAPDEAGTGAASYANRDVKIVAWCDDERSKINLRGLLGADDMPLFQHTKESLVRLIDLYREEWPKLDVSDSDARSMVEDLVEWLREKEDSDENPLPASRGNRGRLLALEDLLRVPGGRWKPEFLYDVRDPEQVEEGDFSRRVTGPAEDRDPASGGDTPAGADPAWERQNGVPGLLRYLTVWTESVATPAMRINVNTAPAVVLASLFEPGQEDMADLIVKHRRQGPEPGAIGSSTPETEPADTTSGWFRTKADLTKVEGLGDDLGRYPRLNFFADVSSAVYSLRVVATVVSGRRDGDEDTGAGARDLLAAYQYREVVQRTQGGFLSLHAERRADPILGETEE